MPFREIICGYGEILKHALISDKKFYKNFDINILKILNLKSPFIEKAIYISCKIKKSSWKRRKENQLRKVLNFGYTFGHAYEASLKYSKKLNHGEAVLLGITTSLKFSLNKKYINKNEFNHIMNHIHKIKASINLKNYFSSKDLNKILFFMKKDKKYI